MSAVVDTSGLVRALLPEPNLTVSLVVVTDVAREAERRHHLKPVSALLLAQALAGGALLASLQKGERRVNLQLEVDGPLRGLLVDAGTQGELRGYVKNGGLDVELGAGAFQWRAALGNKGFLSVLRDAGEEYYRSAVELSHFDLAKDLHEYFKTSDQVPTEVALCAIHAPGQPLEAVAGVVVQALPGGDRAALEALGHSLQAKLDEAVRTVRPVTPAGLLSALFPEGCQVLGSGPLVWKCTCSHQRALDTLASLGRDDVQNLIDTLGSTAVTCHFCNTKHEISLQELVDIVEALDAKAKAGRQGN
jgi:molecular chaperone Hsp33